MNTKICKICNVEKLYTEYHKMKGCIGGVRNVCKECRKIEKDEYRSRPEVKLRMAAQYQIKKPFMRERLNKYYWTLVSQYHQYIKSAKKRKLSFELTKEDCNNYYNTNCYYCGNLYKALGIDRVDNNLGYTKDNCVPCCKICNSMKMTMTKENFINHIQLIIKNYKT